MSKVSKGHVASLLKAGVSVTPSLAGKQLWVAMFFNIPVWGFVPFVSQAVTIISVLIFQLSIKHDTDAKDFVNSNKSGYYVEPWVKWLAWGLILLQLVWIPFVLQFLSLIGLGILMFNIKKIK